MELLGERLARGRQSGDIIFLYGGFIRAHTQQKELSVTSPTYLLVNTYDEASDLSVIYHVDLYRLDAVVEQDAAALGLSEAFKNGITLVEWPERFAAESVPDERLDVKIWYDEDDPEIRRVELRPNGERWQKLFATDPKTEM
ncbi:hypothetical protein BBO99_00007559 [Phytophthora kernoviae]|uniref:tRNA threonylcarbamoyladenosine biosynthesis protein TsaE n=2 Tax=Phytophthora kernoviae TaxID=325452 RepID=A0A3R7G3I9_9STRA|nr:hypothetical protein G195_009614 [Phytophthora kernoviae 00238/432]KAG2513515.1 hypothetical protein JM18_008455 [Phytophthora kernoviae]KAG2519762.1 hypothetical protein JM16_007022 [Phytophthora kernoviae]RLN27433.1 hypothetical protein BBI17_007502 [Phytophthora kernoviae]RLN76432.1 hypothetical protein BBO99_00007559 [Phytophthora kernoviae]